MSHNYDTKILVIEVQYDLKVSNLQNPFFQNQRLQIDISVLSRRTVGAYNSREVQQHHSVQYVARIRPKYETKELFD